MDCTRRRFLRTAATTLAAPAIVRFDSLDRLTRPRPTLGYPRYEWVEDLRGYDFGTCDNPVQIDSENVHQFLGQTSKMLAEWGHAMVAPERIGAAVQVTRGTSPQRGVGYGVILDNDLFEQPYSDRNDNDNEKETDTDGGRIVFRRRRIARSAANS